MTSDYEKVTERCPIGAPVDTPKVAAAELRRESLVLGFDQALVEPFAGQLSKGVVVHRETPFSVSTTFPVFCPVSTYLVASTTSSSRYVRSITGR